MGGLLSIAEHVCRGVGNSSSVISGNDIFDAIAGTSGTYLTLNRGGSFGFGFSDQLWIYTLSVIDRQRNWIENPP